MVPCHSAVAFLGKLKHLSWAVGSQRFVMSQDYASSACKSGEETVDIDLPRQCINMLQDAMQKGEETGGSWRCVAGMMC